MNEALNDPSPATSNDQLLTLEYAAGNTGVCRLATLEYASWQHWSMPTGNTGVCQLTTPEYASWQHQSMPAGNTEVFQLATLDYANWQASVQQNATL